MLLSHTLLASSNARRAALVMHDRLVLPTGRPSPVRTQTRLGRASWSPSPGRSAWAEKLGLVNKTEERRDEVLVMM